MVLRGPRGPCLFLTGRQTHGGEAAGRGQWARRGACLCHLSHAALTRCHRAEVSTQSTVCAKERGTPATHPGCAAHSPPRGNTARPRPLPVADGPAAPVLRRGVWTPHGGGPHRGRLTVAPRAQHGARSCRRGEDVGTVWQRAWASHFAADSPAGDLSRFREAGLNGDAVSSPLVAFLRSSRTRAGRGVRGSSRRRGAGGGAVAGAGRWLGRARLCGCSRSCGRSVTLSPLVYRSLFWADAYRFV